MIHLSVQFSSAVQSGPIFCNPWTVSRQVSLSITNSQNLLKLMSIELVMPSNLLILCRPLFPLPSMGRVNSSHEVAKVQEFQL